MTAFIGFPTLKADDNIIVTDPFEVLVKERDTNEPFKNSTDPKAILKMFIDSKNKIFVGQKIPLKVRFYYNSDEINCEAVSEVRSDDFNFFSYLGPYEGYETVENQTFKYLEWTYNIFAKKPGKLTLPEIDASYNVARQDDMYTTVLRMFGAALERKTVNSKPLSFQVFDIPEVPGFEGAIGKFTDLVFTATGDKFSQASPIILKLQIIGDGNFENLKWPKLKLPEAFRVTESKNYFDDANNKITFEYILQGLEAGNYKVGPHEIIFFNPEAEKFGSIKSNYLSLAIEPSEKLVAYEDELDKFLESYDKNTPGEIQEINKFNFAILPNKIFLVLFLGPLIVLIFVILYLIFNSNYKNMIQMFLHKTAFFRAKLKIKSLMKKHKPDQVYDVFDKLFQSRLPNYFIGNAGQDIENVLNFAGQKNIDQEEIQEKIKDWRNFYLVVLSYKFSNYKDSYINNYPKDWIFDKSIYWINELEKLI